MRIKGHTVAAIRDSYQYEMAQLQNCLPADEKLDQIIADATETVDQIINSKKMLEQFHGKDILAEFYKQFVNKTGIGREAFALQIARSIGEDEELRKPIVASLMELLSKSKTQPEAVA